ncbi:MAG: hypothetical protein GQ581_08935 [Methyloprofundus sp.]|nr:hypothetical protein [Methyloprofundus sp.]
MKKIIAALALTLISTVSYAKPYTCTGYFDGKAVGDPIVVNASKMPIAEDKAYDRILYKDGKKRKEGLDYVKCK